MSILSRDREVGQGRYHIKVRSVHPSVEAVSLQTMQTIVRYARNQPTVYLPTHDPESGDRLANAITLRVSEDVVA